MDGYSTIWLADAVETTGGSALSLDNVEPETAELLGGLVRATARPPRARDRHLQ